MRQKGASTGGKKTEDAESARQRKKEMFHILNECEASKNELRIEEFVGEEKGLKLMKWIEKVRRETREKIG